MLIETETGTSRLQARRSSLGRGKNSLKEEAYRAIREKIINGSFSPGDLLKERELAEIYGVSKTPVREALCLLEQENLVEAIPRAGYMVTHITVRDVQETYQLRLLLEAEAIRLAVERITEDEIKALEEKADASSGEQMRAFNREFHIIIAWASGNSKLAKLIEKLIDEMDRMMALDPHIFAPTGPYEHSTMLEALRNRDAELAQEAMREHIEGACRRVLQWF